ncbi:MAG: hypothetical protein RIR76_1955 [Verrucomicrobiota bacterium]|mgnify:CR=1 FL=1|jgi:hypothetical protein|nr:hypothetical protein [Opitutaceae bacterium]
MSDYVLHFAAFIMAIFGVGFYSAMTAFRRIAKNAEASAQADELSAERAKRD